MTRATLARTALLSGATLLLAAPAALAQDTTVVLGGPAAKELRAQGVKLRAVRPAKAGAKRIVLPAAKVGVTGSTAVVAHAGAIALRAGKRTVTLRELRERVGARSTLSATIGGKRRTLATIAAPSARRSVQPTGTYVTESPLVLTGAAVRMLRRELRKPGLRTGRLGTIDLEAQVTASTTSPDSDIPGAPAPTVTGPPTPGGATPSARPASAVTIAGGTVRWSPRESWLGYLASAEGASAQAPATFDGRTYTLPITGGWYDPATGAGVVDTAGTAVFQYLSHSLDMAFAAWSYDLGGPAPKAVATVERASGANASLIGSRQPVALITPGVAPVANATSVTWTDVPLTLSGEGVPIYRAYLYGSDQGKITIAATLG